MSTTLAKPWTIDEFLAWEERQELRYEFDGFKPVAMTGGTEADALIQVRLITAIANRLNRPPCRIVGSELKLRVAGRIRYPDAMILCGPRQARTTVVDDPTIVFEILSPSSVRTDLFAKNMEYRSTPSIQRYVILEQTRSAAVAFIRSADQWVSEIVAGDAAILRLPEVGIEVPLAEVYRDITADPDEDDE